MPTAKELHDRLLPMNFRGTEQWSLDIAANADTILRALSLLASVEDGDEPTCERDCGRLARALIVSQRQEIERVKAHAEAMHLQLKRFIGDHFFAAPHTNIKTDEAFETKQVADAYRAANPKDAP